MRRISHVLQNLVWVLLALLIFAVALFAWWLWPEQHHVFFDAFLGGILAAYLTLLVAFIAWRQLGSLSQTTSAQFIIELKRDFFIKDTRLLFQLIDNNWLEYVEVENGEQAFFTTREADISKSGLDFSIIRRLTRKKVYSTYDIDDCLLGHFEDIGFLEKTGILDIEMVYQEFSYYIVTAWDNRDICKYIKAEREGSSEKKDIYEHFEYIAKKCKEWEKIRGCIFGRFSLCISRR